MERTRTGRDDTPAPAPTPRRIRPWPRSTAVALTDSVSNVATRPTATARLTGTATALLTPVTRTSAILAAED